VPILDVVCFDVVEGEEELWVVSLWGCSHDVYLQVNAERVLTIVFFVVQRNIGRSRATGWEGVYTEKVVELAGRHVPSKSPGSWKLPSC
jgi:hypothetical protein